MSSHTTLSAATDDRKARLAKLKSLKRKQPEPSPSEDDQEEHHQQAPSPTRSQSPPTKEVSHLHLSGRNYDPETRGPKLGFEAPPTLSLDAPTLEEKAADLEDEVNRQAALDAARSAEKGIDLFKLQPKKPNWDLKRELNAKMEVLNVRTDNAIARMVRERLAEKKKLSEQGAKGSAESEDKEADGMLDGAAIVEGIKLREREEEEEARREKEAEDEELGIADAQVGFGPTA
ncbi:putative cell cycle control protein [Triangularia verruculosa]|uniref:Cell cycle control protein n=1 Tax=Triangularia verruculosa TaxID=2587418 RepID=A0AAN6XHC8_9PEZI|nr:putative cell cycle control protein [Triangularia verruculosa]